MTAMWIIEVGILLTTILAAFGNPTEHTTHTSAPPLKACDTGKYCVPYERCNEGFLVDGRHYPDRSRTLLDEQNCHYMEKCCSINETLPTPAPYNIALAEDSQLCGWRHDLWYYLRPLGYKQQESKFGEFPWLVAIYHRQLGYLCSGALLTPLAVLTAAHCLHNVTEPADLQLVAGEWDAAVQLEPLPQQQRQVQELLLHVNYTQTPVSHNLALLFVAEAFQLAPHVQTICLPPPQMIYNYSQCYVAGWQRTDFGAAVTLPKRWPLYILPRDQCTSKLKLAILGRRFALNETLLCTGGDKGDFVCGDGGNLAAVPLMCPLTNHDDRYVLAGLLARGARCDGPQLLGIYTNIKFYRRWIDHKLRERELDIRSYMV